MDDSPMAPSGSELVPPIVDDYESGEDELDETLVEKGSNFLRLCWARRKLVFGILGSGVVLSFLAAFTMKATYISTTTLMPPENASPYSNLLNMLTSASSAASLGSAALGLNTPAELYVSILGSRTVQDDLIAQFGLMDRYKSKMHEDARKKLKGDTTVAEDRKSGIITVSVRADDPTLASNLAKAYVDDLNRVVTENSTSSARRERIFLEGRLKDIKQQLDDSAKALSQFSSKSGAFDMATQAKSMMDAGLRLQTELIDGRGRLAALRQTYSEDNPRVRAAEARNAELQRQLDKLGGLAQDSGSDANSANAGFPAARKLPTLGLTYYDLERKLRVDEALWEALTKQYEAAKVEEAQEIPTIRVLDPANFPERKAGPARRLVIEVGTALSLVLAIASVLAVTAWEQMGEQDEPKKLITDVTGAALDDRRWYWRLPGLKKIYSRLVKR
jgi:uncharacterized protein involved in exopolysaccharide biosynthesis